MDILDGLNEQQKTAILESVNKDTCLIAGAGAGKTAVIVRRVQYLIKECGISPENIMCITFTRKAANELLDRVKTVTEDYNDMWVGTFHSICIKILRMFGEEIGIKEDFTILTPYYAEKTAKDILAMINGSWDKKTVKGYLRYMSKLKNELITPRKHRENKLKRYSGNNEALKQDRQYEFIEFYEKFQKENFTRGILDFDDIILYTVLLIKSSKNTREYIHRTFKYVLGDEIQDSNISNMILLNLLSKNRNLFVVGDADQSIYAFRGAKPDLIMNFDKIRNNSHFLVLEQNYRSTKNIVEASNFLIENNTNRPDKVCFSNGKDGDKIQYSFYESDKVEAISIAEEIKVLKEQGYKYGDIMILYRTNMQSKAFEDAFIKKNIPYNVIGSTNFTERAEIMDCMSFLRIFVNKKDKQSFKRVLSSLDGVGAKTIGDIMLLMDEYGDILTTLRNYTPKTKKVAEALKFIVDSLVLITEDVTEVLNLYIKVYIEKYLKDETAVHKLENIQELERIAAEDKADGLKVKEFVEKMDLLTSKDKENANEKVNVMTIHASKGLEAPVVFVAGLNDDILPHKNSLDEEGIENERCLLYVACTRAKEKLFLSSFRRNSFEYYDESRFLIEIPDQYMIKCI